MNESFSVGKVNRDLCGHNLSSPSRWLLFLLLLTFSLSQPLTSVSTLLVKQKHRAIQQLSSNSSRQTEAYPFNTHFLCTQCLYAGHPMFVFIFGSSNCSFLARAFLTPIDGGGATVPARHTTPSPSKSGKRQGPRPQRDQKRSRSYKRQPVTKFGCQTTPLGLGSKPSIRWKRYLFILS